MGFCVGDLHTGQVKISPKCCILTEHVQTTVAHCPLDTAVWHVHSVPCQVSSITQHPEVAERVGLRLGLGLVCRVLGPNYKGPGQKEREGQPGCGHV